MCNGLQVVIGDILRRKVPYATEQNDAARQNDAAKQGDNRYFWCTVHFGSAYRIVLGLTLNPRVGKQALENAKFNLF